MWTHPAWLIALSMALSLFSTPALAAPPGFFVHPGEHPGVTEARALVFASTLVGKEHTSRLHYQCGHLRGDDLAACDRVCGWPAGGACGFVTQHGAIGAALLDANPARSGDARAAALALGLPEDRAAAAALHLQTRLGWDDPGDPTRPPRPLSPARRRDLLRADVRLAGARDAISLDARAKRRADTYREVFGESHPEALMARVEADLAVLDAGLPAIAAKNLERSVRVLEGALPEDHPELARARIGQARALFWSGDVERARGLAERATRALERVYGPRHWALIPALVARSDMHLDVGEPMRAVTLAERAFSAAVAHGDSWSPLAFDPLLAMARAQVALDDTNDPSFILTNIAQIIARADFSPSRRQRIDLELTRAAIDFRRIARLGDGIDQTIPEDYRAIIQRSNASLTKARELLLETYGEGHWYHARVMLQFGEFFVLADSLDSALGSFDIAKTYAQMARADAFIMTLRLDELRARALAAKGEVVEASDLARGVAAKLDAEHPRRLLDRARAHRTHALTLWRLGQMDEARAAHSRARALLIAGLRLDSGERVGDSQLLRYFAQFVVMVQEGISLSATDDVRDTLDALLELQGSAMRLSRDRFAWRRIAARVPAAHALSLAELREGEASGFASDAQEESLRGLLSRFEPSLAVSPEEPGREAICERLGRERAHLVNYMALIRHRGFEDDPKSADRYNGARTGMITEMTFEAIVVDSRCRTRLVSLGALAKVREEIESYRAKAEAAEACYEQKGSAIRCRRALGELDSQGARVRALVWDPVEEALGGGSAGAKEKRSSVSSKGTVYVVPDDKLTLVPLDGLPYEDGSYVIERRAITLLPYSLALVATPRDLEHVKGASRGGSGAFVLGDVDYGEGALGGAALGALRTCNKRGCSAAEPDVARAAIASVRVRGASAPMSSECVSKSDWGALQTEALGVAELLSGTFGRDVLLSTGDGATEFVARTLLPGRRVIHLATHGFFSTSAPCLLNASRPIRDLVDAFAGDEPRVDFTKLGAVVLAGANAGSTDARDDGLLNGADIASLDLTSAELVVLSACQTALGIEVAGEGSFGLTRGFVLAGARDVVGSLWQVPSQPTADLFRDMYTGMMSKRTRDAPPQALRRAKLKAIDRARAAGVSASSFLWAAFVPLRSRR